MNRPKMPELKLSREKLKVPGFAQDVFYDLRERRLLPLVALIVVAIVAAPFLLSAGSEQTAEPATVETPVAGASGANGVELTVVRSNPGLRDYRKRLAKQEPTDPFKQRYTHSSLEGAQVNSETGGGATGASVTSSPSSTPEGGGASVEPVDGGASAPAPPPDAPSPPPADGGDGKPKLTYYSFAIKVRIAKHTAGGKSQEPATKEEILPLTPLPGEKAVVVTFMGTTKKGNALLMVSNEVKSVFGDVKCASGEDVCQLIEVETGLPVTFVYGYNETRYTINVLKIEPVVTGHG